MKLLVLDLDNSVWNKQNLDDYTYRKVSKDIFGLDISMLLNADGTKDTQFANEPNEEIWRRKIEETIEFLDLKEISVKNSFSFVDKSQSQDSTFLLDEMGKAGVDYLSTLEDVNDVVQLYLSLDNLKKIRENVDDIGVLSSGSEILQTTLLDKLGLYDAGINKNISYFAGEKTSKLLMLGLSNKADNLIYIGDSTSDMSATDKLKGSNQNIKFHAVGVETGHADNYQLYQNGADLVIKTLADNAEVDKVINYINALD